MSTAIQLSAGLAPSSMADLLRICDWLAKSAFVPKDYRGRPQDIAAAVMMGSELGLPTMQALQNIAVINGKPAIYGDAALAVCKAHPAFEDIEERSDDKGATCIVKRKGQTDVSVTFTVDDAKRAGLWGKSGPWTQYPKRMLQMRARGFALRDAFPDALKGLITREEAEDCPVAEGRVVSQSSVAIEAAQSSARAPVTQRALAASKAHDGPTIADFQKMLSEAVNKGSAMLLDAAAELAGDLPDDDKARARQLYKEAKGVLETASQASAVFEDAGSDYGPPPFTDDELRGEA